MTSPPVTFVVLGYRQEQYIREAIEGAFSQAYSPLEIILSDDCSPDGTFLIMEEMAGSYTGPHQVIARQTAVNVGLSAHLDEVADLAQGEWIVIAAGDDISLPGRVARHMELAATHPDASSTFLAPVVIGNSRSNESVPKVMNKVLSYPETLKSHGGGILGATHAIRKSTWSIFGPLGKGRICEDWALAFRSSLIGEVIWDETPGISYRLHEQSITSQNFGSERYGKQLMVECDALRQFSKDLKCAVDGGHVSATQGAPDLLWLDKALLSNEMIASCINADSIGALLRTSYRLLTCREFVVGNYRRRIGVIRSALRHHFTRA
ncbi:MAG: glycosyltransferase [bacterium]